MSWHPAAIPARIAGAALPLLCALTAAAQAPAQGASAPQPPAPPRVQIRLPEVTQGVQDVNNGVPLIAGRTTWVRVYATVAQGSQTALRARIRISPAGGGAPAVYLSDAKTLVPGAVPARGDYGSSLNLRLPDGWSPAGLARIEVAALIDGAGRAVECIGCGVAHPVEVRPSEELRVHVFGVVYPVGNRYVQVDQEHFDRLESWLARAFPVSRVRMVRRALELQRPWNPNNKYTCNEINTLLSDWRSQDEGVDPRTRYYAMISDDGNIARFVGGCSSDPYVVASPSVVATGPAGSPSIFSGIPGGEAFTWDADGSYADWYGAHEIGHTFGRRHPGYCGNQVKHDTEYPYQGGAIGGARINGGADEVFGLDGGVMTVLDPSAWFDVMSYCSNLWVSAYTYRGLADRMARENALLLAGNLGATPGGAEGAQPTEPPLPGANAGAGAESEPWIIVIGRFSNLDRNEAEIRRVVEVSTPPPAIRPGAEGATEVEWVEIRLVGSSGTDLGTHRVPLLVDAVERHPHDESGAPQPRTAMLSAIVPNPVGLRRVELVREGRVVAAYAARESDIRPVEGLNTSGAPVAGSQDRQFSWGVVSGSPTYFVQMSYDGGASWLTIDQRRHTSAVLPFDYFKDRQTARLRVVAVLGTSREVVFTSDELIPQQQN